VQLFSRLEQDPAGAVALETTLLVHGLPPQHALPLLHELERLVGDERALPALIGVVRGIPTVGVTHAELAELLDAPDVPKANTANLGLLIHRGSHAATTVSATMELAAGAGIRLLATGGIGGIHRDYARRLDVSSDLAALTRFPLAVVASGVKSLLDVGATREAIESLGIPVIGFGTDAFPAFYLRESDAGVDARFDDVRALARFLHAELARTARAILIANPIPAEHAISSEQWHAWLADAEAEIAGRPLGRDVTPALLDALHRVSDGATLRANLELVKANARLAAALCREILELDPTAPYTPDP